MDLHALYDLKERLEHAAIAGTGLLQEDFRLRRAAEALAPLASASPVFAKITAAVQALLNAPADQRGKKLLDALSLVDAVAYTQGTVDVPGDLKPLERGCGACVQASYGQLQPLIAALRGTGSGRFSQIRAAWEAHPEHFGDFRVLPYVVQALGDPYGELSDLIFQILRSQGTAVIPLLKSGFDGKGKREMARRVELIEAIAGAGENDFYRSQLEGAEKEVRCALIYALRHDEANAQKLLELCQTERAAGKHAAHWALAKLESPAVWDYWGKLAAKDPDQAAEYMTLSTAPRAGELVAGAVDRWLDEHPPKPSAPMTAKDAARLQDLLYALPGKSGGTVCRLYRRMAALDTAMDAAAYTGPNGQTMALRLRSAAGEAEMPFSRAVPLVLRRSILLHPAPDLVELAGELSRRQAVYRIPEITAALLTLPAAQAYDAAEPCLKTAGLVVRKRPQESAFIVSQALRDIRWDEKRGELAFQTAFADPAGGSIPVSRPIQEPLDRRWYRALTAVGGDEQTDACLAALLYPEDAALCRTLGEYLYKRALTVSNNRNYLVWLRCCGWTECRGLLESYCKKNRASTWEVMELINRLPGGPGAAADEAERVLKLAREKKIAMGAWNPTHIERQIAALREQAANT